MQVPAHKKTAPPASSVSLQQEDLQTGSAGESTFDKPSSSVLSDPSVAGAFAMPPEPFGETGRMPDKCIGPLGKILTYKNLIYY